MSDAEHTRAEIEEMAALLGGEAQQVRSNPDEQEVYLVLNKIRGLLLAATAEENIGASKLAARLGVSTPAASRMMHREGDMRVSTAVLWARALNREWNLELSKAKNVNTTQNFQPKWEIVSRSGEADSRSDASHTAIKRFNSGAVGTANVSITKVGV